MTPGEFWEAMDAYRQEAEANRRHVGELARGLGVRIVNLFVKQRITDASKFWTMPWDNEGSSLADTVRELGDLSDEERNEKARHFLAAIDNGKSQP